MDNIHCNLVYQTDVFLDVFILITLLRSYELEKPYDVNLWTRGKLRDDKKSASEPVSCVPISDDNDE